ncbi:ATP-binding protein [Ureibacillus sp. FSL K6-2830]|uniref:ATP-binding protein n=1 Tax=Ureibacillus sp. FSL K6-2830 TaxID=2954610 RepID=UPI0030F7FCDA
MVKPINLFSLLNAKEDLYETNFIQYLEQFGINPRIRTSEFYDLHAFVEELRKKSKVIHIYNGYYVGYMIKQIGKEFDLLRIGKDCVINIELKREGNVEKITKQLVQNRHYLKFLDVDVYNFTYVSSINRLYKLNENHQIEEVDFHFLIDKLIQQQIQVIENLDDLFDPSNYLVSPFNSTEAFMEDKYFLSAQQSTYKREIIHAKPTNQSKIFAIEGGPGTGKSLLTYDIAKEYIRQSKNVIIFNCGRLNGGHLKLIEEYKWPIVPISKFQKVIHKETDLSKYDLIIFDEVQRLYIHKLQSFIHLLEKSKTKCIFSYDPNQVLTTVEMRNKVPKIIETTLKPVKYELTEVVRYNKEIHSFIKKLFDLSTEVPVQQYSNVSIQYFSSIQATKSYLCFLQQAGWKVIDFTPSRFIDRSNNQSNPLAVTTADVIGQEFDHVVAVIDDSFYYKPNHKLAAKMNFKKPYYQPTKMLYQNISRARKKLHVVVVNNLIVMDKILKILNG